MLFRPFRFKTWLKLGFIGWLAGAASSGGGGFNNFQNPGIPAQQGSKIAGELDKFLHTLFTEYFGVIVLLAVIGVLIWLVFVYLSARFRFILFDAVLNGRAEIARSWRQYRDPAHRFLAFWLLFSVIILAVFFLIVGLPLWRAYKGGILQSEDPFGNFFHLFAPIFVGVLAFAIVTAIVASLANDFLVPQLALDDIDIGNAWTNLTRMVMAEPGAFAGYLGMKFLLSIAAAIIVGIATFLCILVLAIPGVVLALIVVFAVKAMGSAGIVFGILMAVLGIAVAIVLMTILILMTIAPTAVFFTAYSLQFFGGRYAKLGERLWPPAAATPLSPYVGGTPPPPVPGTA